MRFRRAKRNTTLETGEKRAKLRSMKFSTLALAAILTLPTTHAQNQAKAEWIPENTKIVPGQTFRTVIHLTVDKGWHTYWENPGEGGLPIKAIAELPEGWTLGSIQFPAPKAFMTGPLHGFGYEGEILFPLTITPPPGSEATEFPQGIVPKITWLTCSEKSCVPGKAEPTLSAPDPDLVAKAYDSLPKEIPGASLAFDTSGDAVHLSLTLPSGSPLDPSSWKIFPVNRNVIDPSSTPTFVKDVEKAETWTAIAPKSEYLDGAPDSISLVLVDSSGKAWFVTSAQ